MNIPDETELPPGLAAELLGVPMWTLHTLIDQGKIVAVRTAGGHRRVLAGSVDAYRRTQPQEES